MATITLSINGTTVGDLSVTTVLAESESNRLMSYLQQTHGKKDVDGEMVDRTPDEMVAEYWRGIVAGTVNNVIRSEKERAAKEAADQVKEFVIT
jgi:hypothetical protein